MVSGNVIAVKTHHADTRELPKDVQLETGKERYDRALVVIRNPFDALVSEANRRWNSKRSINSHVGIADETTFVSKFILFSDLFHFVCSIGRLLLSASLKNHENVRN